MEQVTGEKKESGPWKTVLSRLHYFVSGSSRIVKKAVVALRHRFDPRETLNELKELGRKHGPRFLVYAICVELFEDLAIPTLLCWAGKPHLIPAALALHLEPVAYPAYFAIASLRKRSPKKISREESRRLPAI